MGKKQDLDFEELLEELWTCDSVTGNGSGSYTFSTWQAEDNLCHNWDLIEEVAEAYGIPAVISTQYQNGAEFWDVSIRCYLLADCLREVLEDVNA